MRKPVWVFIFTLFIVSIGFRTLFIAYSGTPIVYQDELLYLKTANSVFHSFNTDFRNNFLVTNNLLYSLVISIAFCFHKIKMTYFIIKFINCILISSAVFPVFLLAQKVLKNIKLAGAVAIVSLILPDMFQTLLVMQESLYYPVMMWVLYVIYLQIDRERDKNILKSSLLLSFMFILCYLVKAVGLAVIVSYILYLIVEYVLIKPYKFGMFLRKITFVAIGFIGFYELITRLIYVMNGSPEINTLYSSMTTLNTINFDIIVKFISGVSIYLVYTLIAFVILPIVLALSKLNRENNTTNRFTYFIVILTLITIIIINILIFIKETEDIYYTRILIRYYFMYFIVYLILALRVVISDSYSKRLVSIVSVIILVGSCGFMFIFKLQGYPLFFESPMLEFLKKNAETKKALFISIIGICSLVSLGLYSLKHGRWTAAKGLIAITVIISFTNSSMIFQQYRGFYQNSSVYGSKKLGDEIYRISDYLSHQGGRKEITIALMPKDAIGREDSFAMLSLDLLLDFNYVYIPFENVVQNQFQNGEFNLVNYKSEAYVYTNSPKTSYGKVDYLITSQVDAEFQGIEKVEIPGGSNYFNVYKILNKKSFTWENNYKNTYDDHWNNGDVELTIASDKMEQDITLTLDAPGNPVQPEITISDATNQIRKVKISNTQSTEIVIHARKKENESFIKLILHSDDSYVPSQIYPDSPDVRKIAFRVVGIKH